MAHARTTDSATSKNAARSVRVGDKERLYSLIHRSLKIDGPATAKEIALDEGETHERIWRRIGELFTIHHSVVPTREQRNGSTVWRLARPIETAYLRSYAQQNGLGTPEPALRALLREARHNDLLRQGLQASSKKTRRMLVAYKRKAALNSEAKDMGIEVFMAKYPL